VSFKLHDENQVDYYTMNGHKHDFTNNAWSDANFQNFQSQLVVGENTMVLYDAAGNSTTYTFTYAPIGPSLSITAPANDGDYATSTYDFTASYTHGVTTKIDWAVRSGASKSCSGGTTVAGNVGGHKDASTFSGGVFSTKLDTTAWSDGSYCFVVNDLHGNRPVRVFNVDNAGAGVPAITSPYDGESTTTAAFARVSWTPVSGTGVTYVYQSAYQSDATTTTGAFVHPKWTTPSPITNTYVPTNIKKTGDYYFHVRAIDAHGVMSAWSPIVEVHVLTKMPISYTYKYATSTVQKADLVNSDTASTGWFFWNVNNKIVDNTLGSFVNGPATAPLGDGSAQVSALAGYNVALATNAFNGTALADIAKLSYATYLTSAAANAGYSLAFDVTTGGSNPVTGLLTYTPTESTGAWQSWNAATSSAAAWSFDSGSLGCTTGSPCTWSNLLSKYPNMAINGKTYLEAMAQSSDFEGNVDDFEIGVASGATIAQTAYDFEPTAEASAAPTSGGGGAGGLLGDLNKDGKVNIVDFAFLMAQYGKHGANLSGDLNNDGVVDGADLAIMLGNWTS
jgi:hypothetical protein